jgi:hypothetical protein
LVVYPALDHVDLENPTGGETYPSGDSVTVSWVEVQAHNTLNREVIKADIPYEARSYKWGVPAILTVGGKILCS